MHKHNIQADKCNPQADKPNAQVGALYAQTDKCDAQVIVIVIEIIFYKPVQFQSYQVQSRYTQNDAQANEGRAGPIHSKHSPMHE